MTEAPFLELSQGPWTARIELLGAQLRSLAHHGEERLWTGDPRWNKSAPLLFPVTGRLADDTLRVEGRSFAHPMHGLARESLFRIEQSSSWEALLSLDRTYPVVPRPKPPAAAKAAPP